MTDSPDHIKSNKISLPWFCSGENVENGTHGHDSCLEDPFVDFDCVAALTARFRAVRVLFGVSIWPHPRMFPEAKISYLLEGLLTPYLPGLSSPPWHQSDLYLATCKRIL